MARFLVTVDVDDDDLARFAGDERDLRDSLAARLSEVYDNHGNPLTTMHVVALSQIAV